MIQCIADLIICTPSHKNDNKGFVALGDKSSKRQWVYLSGLTFTFDSSLEMENRKTLDKIGHELGIGFVAIKPESRSSEFNNMLCWPHHSVNEVFSTYKAIVQLMKHTPIAGWIGFSNGGFFLNQLVQHIELEVPVIAIGAAGYLHRKNLKNHLYLLVGNQDVNHYTLAKKLHQQAEGSALLTDFIEYEGNHKIPLEALMTLLNKISSLEAHSILTRGV